MNSEHLHIIQPHTHTYYTTFVGTLHQIDGHGIFIVLSSYTMSTKYGTN